MSANNGGPAFPSHGSMGEVVCEGMTLRDYFAAKAMQGFLSCSDMQSPFMGLPKGRDLNVWLCEAAYDYADAMLAARGES